MDTVAIVQTTGWLLVGATMMRAAVWFGAAAISNVRRQRQSRIELAQLLRTAERYQKPQTPSRPAPKKKRPVATRMRIVHRKYETPDQSVCSLYLAAVEGARLPQYRPGQFITIELQDDQGKTIRRCYSLSQTPTEPQNYYRISVKRLTRPANSHPGTPGGVASTLIVDGLAIGDTISTMPPAGNFTIQHTPGRPIVLIAGGIGITPLMSMLNWLVATGCENEIWLIQGVRNSSEHAFREEIANLRELAPNFETIVFYSQPTRDCRHGIDFDYAGRMDLRLITPLLKAPDPVFYVCGPTSMMNAITSELRAGGVEPNDIHTEAFGTGRTGAPTQPPQVPDDHDANTRRSFNVFFSGSERRAVWQPHHGSLLEFAEVSGIDARYSCRAGQCGSCKVRLRSGKVAYATAPTAEMETGFCLPCVAQPASDLVVEL